MQSGLTVGIITSDRAVVESGGIITSDRAVVESGLTGGIITSVVHSGTFWSESVCTCSTYLGIDVGFFHFTVFIFNPKFTNYFFPCIVFLGAVFVSSFVF